MPTGTYKVSNNAPSGGSGKKYSNKDNKEKIKNALKHKTLTQKQVDVLPEKLLMGIINKKGCGCGCKGGKKKS